METYTDDRDWIAEGAKVALYRFRAWGPADVRYTTVAKLTRTQIVLDNGDRYRRDNLHAVGGSYSSPSLLPADDPKVTEALREQRFRDVLSAVKREAEKVRTDHEPREALVVLDELARVVADAQALLAEED